LFDGKRILITGGTGSLGRALTKRILNSEVDTIRIFSRDELKQSEMKSEYNDSRLRFLIGDIRDKNRLYRALEDIDIVIHTAALKQVPAVEYNPFEAVKTNVYGTQNLIDACLDKGVKTALAVGTDKAVAPFNTYGATKLLMERLFISSNYYKGNRDINFVCVRYGNVLGSRGSIVPTLINQIQNNKKITITDPEMTRFNITMSQAVDLIMRALGGLGGEVFIPKLKAYKTGVMKDAIMELLDTKIEVDRIPVRPGEKYHESLISKDEIRNSYETLEDYILFEEQTQHHKIEEGKTIRKSNLEDKYSSDRVELLTKEKLKEILLSEKLIPQK
jgi:UDP-N-acetylglucosamine 4,6-dehydratase/UDP-glucose 4-epimerase